VYKLDFCFAIFAFKMLSKSTTKMINIIQLAGKSSTVQIVELLSPNSTPKKS